MRLQLLSETQRLPMHTRTRNRPQTETLQPGDSYCFLCFLLLLPPPCCFCLCFLPSFLYSEAPPSAAAVLLLLPAPPLLLMLTMPPGFSEAPPTALAKSSSPPAAARRNGCSRAFEGAIEGLQMVCARERQHGRFLTGRVACAGRRNNKGSVRVNAPGLTLDCVLRQVLRPEGGPHLLPLLACCLVQLLIKALSHTLTQQWSRRTWRHRRHTSRQKTGRGLGVGVSLGGGVSHTDTEEAGGATGFCVQVEHQAGTRGHWAAEGRELPQSVTQAPAVHPPAAAAAVAAGAARGGGRGSCLSTAASLTARKCPCSLRMALLNSASTWFEGRPSSACRSDTSRCCRPSVSRMAA